MAFPQDPLAIRGEIQINGTWVDITTRIRGENAITVQGGYTPEQTSVTASSVEFAINNRDGLFSNDNPNSIYYGLLPTNTAFRTAVKETLPFLRLPNGLKNDPLTVLAAGWQVAWAETADKASLDVTGDLDLRIEVEPDQWTLGSCGQQLVGKYTTTGAQRSWAWVVQASGKLRFYWSPAGATPLSTSTFADSTAVVPGTSRIALRVTIDVDNGAAGRTITFYTSDSITGTWTMLGSPVVQAGTTSIFSSSALLTVGAIGSFTGGPSLVTDATAGYTLPLLGRIYRFQMYSGIGGTLVADMNPTTQAEGTTSWSDGLASPNFWAPLRGAEVTKSDYRGCGEIAEMPQEWDPTGTDVYIPTVANGLTRRLTQGAKSLDSPIFRMLRAYIGAGAVGYWPLEGGSQSTAAGSAIPGQPAGRVNNVLFSSDPDFPATAGVMTLNDAGSYVIGDVRGARDADQAQLIFYHRLDAAPAADTEIVSLYLSGSARRVTFVVSPTTYQVKTYDATGTLTSNTGAGFGAAGAPGQWMAVQMRVTKNGTGIDINLAWYPLGTTTSFYGITPATLASSTVGKVTGAGTMPGGAASGLNVSVAHIMALNLAGFEFANATFANASRAFVGELAALRWMRLLREENIEGRCVGWPADSIAMGPQPIDRLTAVLDDCASTAGALQYEARDMNALVYRTAGSLYVQQPVTLTYARPSSHLSGSFRPTFDDRLLRNEVTAQSPGGAFAVSTVAVGPRSTLAPPNGVGRYDTVINVNPAEDEQLPNLAGDATFRGTWPERRAPNIEVWLQRKVFATDAALTRAVRSVNPGDRLSVASPPIWVGGATVDTLVTGYREVLRNRGHEIAFATVPYGPYRQVSNLTGNPSIRRVATDYGNARIALAATSAATGIVVQTTEGATFGTTSSKPGNFPAGGGPTFTLNVAGEQVNVTAIAGWIADDFNRVAGSTWGSTSTGAVAWVNAGGTAANFSTNGSRGVHDLATTAVDRVSALGQTARIPEVRVTHMLVPSAVTGVGGNAMMTIRIGTSTDYVGLNVQFPTSGGMSHWVNQVVGGVETAFDSLFPQTGVGVTTAISAVLHVEAASAAFPFGRVLARVWAEGAVEPGPGVVWTTSVAMTALNAIGDVQLRSTRNASSTNVAPFYTEWDGFNLPRNQTMAVTRSVNNITKAQSVDNIVTLVDEFYAART